MIELTPFSSVAALLSQTPRQYIGEKNTHYCVITNFLKPLLEEIEFWKRQEQINAKVFGLMLRSEPGAEGATVLRLMIN